MSEPVKSTPIKSSAIDAVRLAVEAKNASQKADLKFFEPDMAKRNNARLEAAERAIEALRQRIEVLEAEDNVQIPWSGDKS